MMHFLSGNGWLVWYGGLLFAVIVLPAKFLARHAGLRVMDESFPVFILKKLIRTLFRNRQ